MADAASNLIPFLLRVLEVALGIGLVIFVHELGHFLVAKKVGIRVETFSLGFGPRLLGFVRGGTDYRLSAIPLGGYVKMAGENPDEARSGAGDEFAAKSVGARAAVISAGVIMNGIFAIIFFLVAFKIGVQMHVPVVGEVIVDSPAAAAGLQRGDEILRIDGEEPLDFVDIGLAAAFADERGLELTVRRRGDVLGIHVQPRRDVKQEFQQLGVSPIDEVAAVEPGGAAEKAGIRRGDRILGVAGKPPESHDALAQTIYDHPGEPLALDIWRRDDASREGKVVAVTVVPSKKPARTFGMKLSELPRIHEVSPDQPAAKAGLKPGDVIVGVNGVTLATVQELQDKIRAAPPRTPVKLEIERAGKRETIEATPAYDEARKRQMLGVVLDDLSGVVEAVAPGSPAAQAGVQPGMRVASVTLDGQPGSPDPKKLDQLASLRGEKKTLFLLEDRAGKAINVEIASAPIPEKFYGGLDFVPGPAEVNVCVPGLWEPIKLGFKRTWMFMEQIGLMLKGIFARRISKSTLGGPIAIGTSAYAVAARGPGSLLYFLAVISVNLAVLNLLPVPVLDGGHLLFLGIEKAKGSPVSPGVQMVAQYAGLVALLALMIFVTWNDIMRIARP